MGTPVPNDVGRRASPIVQIGVRTMLIAALVVFGALAAASISHALLVVFLGIFIGLVLAGPTDWIMRKTGLGRGLSATITVLGTIVLLGLLALLLLVPLVESVRDWLQGLPDLVQRLRDSDELGFLGDTSQADSAQNAAQQVADKIPDAVSAVLGLTGELFSAGLTIFSLVFIALFFITDMPNLKAAFVSIQGPDGAERTSDLWDRIAHTVSRWAIGAGIIAVIAGTVQGTTAWLLGSSYALALGVLAGFLDLIPNLGATIAGFVLSLTLLAEEGLTAALIMAVVVLVYQQVENNLLTPTIQGKAVNISGFFVITSVTIFGSWLGVIGALIAVPVTASIQIIVTEFTRDRRERNATLQATAEAAADQPTG